MFDVKVEQVVHSIFEYLLEILDLSENGVKLSDITQSNNKSETLSHAIIFLRKIIKSFQDYLFKCKNIEEVKMILQTNKSIIPALVSCHETKDPIVVNLSNKFCLRPLSIEIARMITHLSIEEICYSCKSIKTEVKDMATYLGEDYDMRSIVDKSSNLNESTVNEFKKLMVKNNRNNPLGSLYSSNK